MLRALDENPGRWDLSCVLSMVSSGVMWSQEVKHGLLRHLPQAALADSFGSSEAVGLGLSVTTVDGEAATAKFQIGDTVKVFTPEGREVAPGSGEVGLIARADPLPEGYYKDQAKTDATFKRIDGVRYSMPGDSCTVEADGTHHPARPRQQLHQHRRREGLPRGGRGGPEASPGHRGRAGRGRAGREVGPGGDRRDRAARRTPVSTRPRCARTPASTWPPTRPPRPISPVARMFRAPNGKADYKSAREAAIAAVNLSLSPAVSRTPARRRVCRGTAARRR